METEDVDTIDEMRRFGGSFLKALAEAAARADESNLIRLKLAFPDYWNEYAELGKRRRATRT